MRNIGFIGTTNPPATVPEGCVLYSFDTTKPLELMVITRSRTATIRNVEGYFYPLGEMTKRVDGPIYISVPGHLLEGVFAQLDEAVEWYQPTVVLEPAVPVETVERLKLRHPDIEVYRRDDYTDFNSLMEEGDLDSIFRLKTAPRRTVIGTT
jgi:hypothetical protein